ncbi:hypothetical protein FA13DRAFT_1746398 [Coprinellus micaceus]|uniref:Uncharacterized protein n=1 Tax=Coprinellus micaceus TaxID=71717 RepID=A0A4Y7S9X2_COPMI|nr:hypothetical protein FA13DRAFT_1746398 [Coprinellus micaceus]
MLRAALTVASYSRFLVIVGRHWHPRTPDSQPREKGRLKGTPQTEMKGPRRRITRGLAK